MFTLPFLEGWGRGSEMSVHGRFRSFIGKRLFLALESRGCGRVCILKDLRTSLEEERMNFCDGKN